MRQPTLEVLQVKEFCRQMEGCTSWSESWSVPGWKCARQVLWREEYYSDGAGSDDYEGSLEEFSARSDGGFVATGSAEAEGDGDVWCGATTTAAAPAGTAGAAKIREDAGDVGASAGADRGPVWCSYCTRVRAVLGQCGRLHSGTDMLRTVGDDQGSADRGELAGGGTKKMGAEMADTEVPVSEVAPRPDSGRQSAGWIDGVRQVRYYGGGSRATTAEAGGGIDHTHTGLSNTTHARAHMHAPTPSLAHVYFCSHTHATAALPSLQLTAV